MHAPVRIAIFEDNRSFRESLEFLVKNEENLELCASFSNTTHLKERVAAVCPDVILMDINIAPVNGIEAVKLLTEHFPLVKICMQTVFDDEDKVFASLCAGASGYILKGSPPDKVVRAILEVAQGGAAFSPSIAKKILLSFQQKEAPAEFIQLSEREKEVLKYLVEGYSYKMIADACNISYDTAHTHIKNIYEKLHVNSKGEAVSKAIRQRLV